MQGKDIKLLTHEDGFKMVSQNGNLALPPNNEILYDDLGNPSVMVKIPKFTYEDLGLPGSGTHPAFIVDGKEIPYIYISKYQNIVENGRAYSLPYQRPHHTVTFDQAKEFCEAKGKGWHLMSNAEWAAIALWCKKNECMPYGNNNYNYGDYYKTSEKGAPMPGRMYYNPDNPDEGWDDIPYTATGSGPKSWFHNNDFSGIADLNGNVYEWVSGVRCEKGELQVIENNNSAMGVDESATSTLWKAISQAGKYVAPGTSGAIKFGSSGISTDGMFKEATAASGVTIPALVKALALFPNDAADTYRDDYYWVNSTSADRLFYRGGYCSDEDSAGVFFYNGSHARSLAHDGLGFRSAFVELPTE